MGSGEELGMGEETPDLEKKLRLRLPSETQEGLGFVIESSLPSCIPNVLKLISFLPT